MWLAAVGAAWGDDAIEVVAPPSPTSSSERRLDRAAIEALPGRTSDDLLRAMPGLHASAHGGRGKAYQYFLRGFDAVHGGDLAVDVDGVPLNEPSNTHAHGYLDLHLLPTAVVRGARLSPGPFRVEAGDFAIAGAASLQLGLDRPGLVATVGGGSDRSAQATLAWRPAGAPAGAFVVADADVGRGVGDARDARQLRVGVGAEGTVGAVGVAAWVLGYDGAFSSPGVLREDDVAAGRVGFYGAYPGSGGGRSTRALASARAWGGGERVGWQLTAWAGARALALRQNYTGWYVDAAHGDGTAQRYDAATGGLSAAAGWRLADAAHVDVGARARVDAVQQRTDGITPDGAVWSAGDPRAATPATADAWGKLDWRPARWLGVAPGAHASVFLVARGDAPLAWAPALAPRASATLWPDGPARVRIAAGRGLRSPDARGAGGGRAPVATADSVEVGVDADPGRWSLRAAAFGTWVSDEIVFDHLTARYLATGATRRIGVDAGLRARPADGVRVDVDVTVSDGRYAQSGAPIPYAPRLVAVAGVYAERVEVVGWSVTAGVRAWALGPRPLPGGFASRTTAVVDLTASAARGRWGASLDVDDLLASRWRDGVFVYASRWDPASARSELPVRHFTAGVPFAARLALSWRFA